MHGPPPPWQGQPPMPGPGGPYGPMPPPRRSSGSSALLITLAIAVPVVLIALVGVGVVILTSSSHHSTPSSLGAPYSDPVTPYAAPTDSDTPAPDPTTTSPWTDPTTTYAPPPPPKMYYGAIAVARSGKYGRSWDYGTRAAADSKAMRECSLSSCKVLTDFVNACGAVAYNPSTNMYWGGHGDTKAEATRNAISNAGGGHWIVYQCTTRP